MTKDLTSESAPTLRSLFPLFSEYIWLIIRYQVINKSVFFLLFFPIYQAAISFLVHGTGYSSLNSGNIKQVLLTPQGLAITLLSIAIVLVAIATDITAFILIESTRQYTGKLPRARSTFIKSLRMLPRYLHPASLLIVAYVALIVPLSGIGISVGIFKDFKIPNFITSVIDNSLLYSTIYAVAIIAFSIMGIFGAFTFHAIALEDLNPWHAIKRSFKLMYLNFWTVIKSIIAVILLVGSIIIGLFAVAMILGILPSFLGLDTQVTRYITTLTLFLGLGLALSAASFLPPIIVQQLTRHFFRITAPDYVDARDEGVEIAVPAAIPESDPNIDRRHPLRSMLLSGAFISVAMVAIAFPIAQEYAVAADYHKHFQVVSHRGGGDLGPENSVEGLDVAISKGIKWTEMDVQRTKDGKYVVTHDPTFARLSDSPDKPTDLTLDEITKLPVKNEFDEQAPKGHVASLEEFFEHAKGKINIFVELKGASADNQMVDDVVALVKKMDMEDQAVISSLDYDIISYTDKTYPEIQSGYMYFFNSGDVEELIGDYLIMEESAATSDRIQTLKDQGKKTIVWTVNSKDSLEKLIFLPIDGVISDHPMTIQKALQEFSESKDFELLPSFIWSSL